MDEVWLKVCVPEVVFELCIKSVAGEVKGLYDLDGFYISKGQLLPRHFFNEKLNILLTSISNRRIQATEDRSHGVLSSIPADIWL